MIDIIRLRSIKLIIFLFLSIVWVTPLKSQNFLEIKGDRQGKVIIEVAETGEIVHQMYMGPGVVRETFLVNNNTVAVATQTNHTVFWNLKSEEVIRSINERVYAFTPDESAFITFVADSINGGLFLRETNTGNLKARLYEGDFGGPYQMQFSPRGAFLAVEFGSAFPLTDEGYPFPEGVLHSKYWVELFDLDKGRLIEAFRGHRSQILGQFDESGRYYYLKNPHILLDGEPYDEGYRFDLQLEKWENLNPFKGFIGAQQNYSIQAEISGTLHTIANVDIVTYQKYENTQSNRVGAEIEVNFTATANSPACCLEYWSFVAEDSWPTSGSSQCPGTINAPYVDPPKGGYSYSQFDKNPRYNEPREGQFTFFDRPSMSNDNTSGTIKFETSVGAEGGPGSAGEYIIPGTSSAFQWGYTWDLNNKKVEVVPMVFSVINSLNRQTALSRSCFTGWTVTIETPKNPCTEILSPTTTNTANVGSYKKPKKFKIEFRAGPIFSGQNIPGLTAQNFTVTIDSKNAKVASAIGQKDRYILEVKPPGEAEGITANGLYDLEVTCSVTSGAYKDNVYRDREDNSVLYTESVFADIVLIIDRSGSMISSGYIQPAKNAASQFVSYMDINDRVGVVSFSSYASVNFTLTPIISQAAITAAQNAIAGIYASGSTSIGSGLQEGQNQLNVNGENTHSWALILLSDGFENTSPYVSQVIGSIPAKTDIYSIALGPNSDQALLQSIASQTGGQYYLSPDANRLLETYNMIRGKVTGQSTIASVSDQVSQNQTDSTSVVVDNTISEATFSLGWSGAGLLSELRLTLQRPNGSVVDSNSAATDTLISYTSGSTFVFYTIKTPEAGAWIVNVTDINNVTSPIDYTATVNAETDLTIDPQFYSNTYQVGQPITLLMSVSEGSSPLAGADIRVIAQSPGVGLGKWKIVEGDRMPGSFLRTALLDTLKLYDDGAHGDGAANDGVYGNFYLNVQTTGSHVFRFEVSGTTLGGTPFSRLGERSIFIQPTSGQGFISGEIQYQGSNKGQVYVRAWLDNFSRTGIPDYIIAADSVFNFGNLNDGYFSIDAFLDMDGDAGYDQIEPYGAADSSFSVLGYTVIDSVLITLRDPAEKIAVSPNPFIPTRGHTQISFFGTSLVFRKIKIYSKAGRLVKTLEETEGRNILDWDSTGDNGNALASGVYIWVASHSEQESQKGLLAIIR